MTEPPPRYPVLPDDSGRAAALQPVHESRLRLFQPQPAQGSGNSIVPIYVSLFLLLFVFFIVLFSTAELRRDKERAVLSSLDAAFGHLPSRLGLMSLVPAAAPATPGDAFARDVGLLLWPVGPFQPSAAPLSPDMLLSVDVDEARLFEGDSTRLRPELAPLIDRMAVLLQRQDGNQRYRLIWNVATAPGDGAFDPAHPPAAVLQAIARGSAAAAALYASGCPGNAVAIAVGGTGKSLRLDFVRFDAAPPAPESAP